MHHKRPLVTGLLLALTSVGLSCGPLPTDQPPPPACQGKCDGLASDFKDFFSEMKKVDLGDLIAVGAKLTTEQINNQLDNLPYASIQLEPTELYALAQKAQGDLTLKDIESLTSGLAARYGDNAFVTHINQLRVGYLQQHPDRLFAEAAFDIDAQLAPHLSFKAGGLPGRVGFLGSRGISARVVAPFAGEAKAVLNGPVKSLAALRGFVLPRNLKDMEQMAPGESVALQSEGTVGFNIGVGLPIYITTIESFATIHAVFSAGARASVTGKLDIQLIRDQGSKVVVDVGVTDQTGYSMDVGIKSRWGIEGLPQFKLKVGSLDVNATDFAEQALEKLLNKRLALFEATASGGKDHTRHTIARFSFDLSSKDQTMEQALVQALKGDIRLAQALAHQGKPGVSQLLDLARDTSTLSSYFGVHLLSLRFFRQKKDTEGSAVITVGPNTQQLFFDELDKQSGAFSHSQGYRRRTVVSLKSTGGDLVDADFNLWVQLRDANTAQGTRGQILDHVDPLLALFIGKDRLVKRLEPITHGVQTYIRYACPEPSGDNPSWTEKKQHEQCLKNLVNDPKVQQARTRAKAVFAAILAEGFQGGLDPAFDDAADFARKLFELKLAVQSEARSGDMPEVRMVTDYRLTEKAVTSLLAAADGEERFARALYDTLALLDPSFEGQLGQQPPPTYHSWDKDATRPTCLVLKEIMERLRPTFTKYARRYQRYANLGQESYSSKALGQVTLGDGAHLLLVEGKNDMDLASIAEGKAKYAAKLFDKLVSELGYIPDVWVTPHEVVGYTLLDATHPAQTELLVKYDFKRNDEIDFPDVRLYGRGQNAKLIDAGQYSLDALIGK